MQASSSVLRSLLASALATCLVLLSFTVTLCIVQRCAPRCRRPRSPFAAVQCKAAILMELPATWTHAALVAARGYPTVALHSHTGRPDAPEPHLGLPVPGVGWSP